MTWNDLLSVFNYLEERPPLLLCTYIVSSLIVALIVRLFLLRLLAHFTLRTKTDLDDRLLSILKGPISVAIVVFGCYQGLVQSYPDEENLHKTMRGVLLSLTILVWMIASFQASQVILEYLSKKAKENNLVQARTLPLFQITTKTIIVIATAYFIIIAWEANVAGWFASAGIVGIAVGFAAQDTLANLISGISIIADAPFKPGDFIVLDDGDRGRVTDIGIRSTRLITLDNIEIIIPNAIIGNSRIVNQNGGPAAFSRLRIPVGVAYGSDIEKVRKVLVDVSRNQELVIDEPPPRVRLKSFGDSSVDFEVLVWVASPEQREPAVDHMLTSIYKAFYQAGIEIPYPKRDVYLHQVTPKPVEADKEPDEPSAPMLQIAAAKGRD